MMNASVAVTSAEFVKCNHELLYCRHSEILEIEMVLVYSLL